MTHTVHPYAHRLGVIRDWKSRWFFKPEAVPRKRQIDASIRRFLKKRLRGMYVTSVEIERNRNSIRILQDLAPRHDHRPRWKVRSSSQRNRGSSNESEGRAAPSGETDIEEVRSPESQAPVVAYTIAEGLEKRQTFRRVLKQTVEKVMANRDVQGVRIGISGRLGGAEMSRQEEIKRGRVPLQTIRADIDFAKEQAYLPARRHRRQGVDLSRRYLRERRRTALSQINN